MRGAIPALTLGLACLTGASAFASTPDRVPAATPEPLASRMASAPPLIVSVFVAQGIRSDTIARALREVDEIWRPAGFAFVWQQAPAFADASAPAAVGPPVPTLRVIVDYETGQRVGSDAATPLGWIVFDRPGEPAREIHVSYTNTARLLEASAVAVGPVESMPPLQRETYLSRALGRALAHELGHYLLASAGHTRRGLMQTDRSATELFSPTRTRYEIDRAQQQIVASRLMRIVTIAAR
jgi:hypothetical protein